MEQKIVHLLDNELDASGLERWVLIEEDELGKWYGTGASVNKKGEEIIYISDNNSDISYNSALESAIHWATSNGVEIVYISHLKRRSGDANSGRE